MNILDFVLNEYFFEWIFWILFWIEFWIESFLGQIQWKNEFSKCIEHGYPQIELLLVGLLRPESRLEEELLCTRVEIYNHHLKRRNQKLSLVCDTLSSYWNQDWANVPLNAPVVWARPTDKKDTPPSSLAKILLFLLCSWPCLPRTGDRSWASVKSSSAKASTAETVWCHLACFGALVQNLGKAQGWTCISSHGGGARKKRFDALGHRWTARLREALRAWKSPLHWAQVAAICFCTASSKTWGSVIIERGLAAGRGKGGSEDRCQ